VSCVFPFTAVEFTFLMRGSINEIVRRQRSSSIHLPQSSTVDNPRGGSSLSKRILRIRRNAALYYIAGNVIHSRPESFAQLSGHALALANICVVCSRLVVWGKGYGAYFLVEDTVVWNTFLNLLSFSSPQLRLDNDLIPRSLHMNCLTNLRVRPKSKSSLRVSERLLSLVSKPVQSVVHDVKTCSVCLTFFGRVTYASPPSAPRIESPAVRSACSQSSPFLISSDTFAAAQLACGMSDSMARRFKYALEHYSSQENAPVVVDGDFQAVTRNARQQFFDLAKDVRLNCGEGAACIISDWQSFISLICKLEHRQENELISSTWSADHGGDFLKLSGSFRFAARDEEKALPLSFSRTGVRKLFCFALVSDVKETYKVMGHYFPSCSSRHSRSYWELWS